MNRHSIIINHLIILHVVNYLSDKYVVTKYQITGTRTLLPWPLPVYFTLTLGLCFGRTVTIHVLELEHTCWHRKENMELFVFGRLQTDYIGQPWQSHPKPLNQLQIPCKVTQIKHFPFLFSIYFISVILVTGPQDWKPELKRFRHSGHLVYNPNCYNYLKRNARVLMLRAKRSPKSYKADISKQLHSMTAFFKDGA